MQKNLYNSNLSPSLLWMSFAKANEARCILTNIIFHISCFFPLYNWTFTQFTSCDIFSPYLAHRFEP